MTSTKMTEAYVSLVARYAYFWAWPLVNMYNRRVMIEKIPHAVKAGPSVLSPINTLGMLTDYIDPGERVAAHPNQDVIYGMGLADLNRSPVVIQVPDFAGRFWMIAAYDTRTDNAVQLGSMYNTAPGFYLLASTNWQGDVPKGIAKAFRSTTQTLMIAPRVFRDDTQADQAAVQQVLRQIMMYSLADFDGTMKSTDWNALPEAPSQDEGEEETHWVVPERFFDDLPAALTDAPPRPGEEVLYAQVLSVLEAAGQDPALKAAITKAAVDAETQLITPLFEFRNFGLQLPYNWRTMVNGARFGTDYFTRTAIAKSNIGVNAPEEARYFYQDFDADGSRLNGAKRYTISFAKGQTPPVDGFWSLTMYNEKHFFVANAINRYSLGTKSKSMRVGSDGSLTIYVQSDSPGTDKESNWLPSPAGADFSMTIRAYWPKATIADGSWTPPRVRRV